MRGRMDVIASTAPFFLRPVREGFRHFADAGFSGVEVMVTRDETTQDPTSLFAAATEHDLRVAAVHAPFLLLNRWVWDSDPIGKVTRSIEMADHLGAPLVVAHPPYRWQDRYARWLTDDAQVIAAEAGVTLAVENMFAPRLGRIPGPAMHARSLDPYPHLTLDTSHAAVGGADLLETAGAFGDRLAHVHLSNNAGRGWDSHLPVDEGVLPLDALLRRLADAGYEGSVSLELDLRRWMNDPRAMNAVLERNRTFCAASISAPSPATY
jgi:sugar phosphate isomerase/epimerase